MEVRCKKIRGVRLACWIAFKGSRNEVTLPFKSNAPVSGEREFETEADIWDEVNAFCDHIPKLNKGRKDGKQITVGQELYYNQFCHHKYLTEEWMFNLVYDINNSMALEIPIASNLQDCPIRIEDYGAFIKEEIQAIRNGN